ncbi:MAG: hypothetical protein ABI718_10010 [Acidobacteriota bacterium]
MKYARNVHFQIRDGKEQEFSKLFETEVLPMLRKENGFKDELTLISKDRAMGISFWDNKTNADTYHTSTFPKVIEKLNPVITGTPKVENYEVGFTTLRA